MKKYFKKLLITLLAVCSVVCLATGLAACNDKPDDGGDAPTTKVTIKTPVLELSDNMLSWASIAHATGYVVYENDIVVSEQTATTYVITQDYPGTYEYRVKATTTEKGYKDGALSEAKTFKVDPWPLEAPSISINQDTGVISWEAVENATGYDIYENGIKIDSTYTLSYKIEQTIPDYFSYTVKATSTNKAYATSASSAPVEYKVPLHLSFGVEFPEGYNDAVTVNLYNEQGNLVASTNVERDRNLNEDGSAGDYSSYGSARLVVKEWGSYIAKIEDLNGNYVATWAHVSRSVRTGSITIVENVNTLAYGVATVSGTIPAAESEVTVNYVFTAIASEDGYHSIIVDEATTGLQISAAGRTVINTAQKVFKGSFATIEGEVIILAVTFTRPAAQAEAEGEETEDPADFVVSFQIETVNYEVKVPLRVLPESYDMEKAGSELYDSHRNFIYDSCVRHIEGADITASGMYEIFIPSHSVGNTFITLTVNGEQEFDLSGGGIATVHFNAGEDVRLEFELSVSSEVIIYVYMTKADKA